MKILHCIKKVRNVLEEMRRDGRSIGFVPTMGALHEGHISLVRRCKAENAVCVASIFVNPTQFNDKKDLEKYPRTLEKDYEMLEKEECDMVFAPSEKEMYPEPDTRVFHLGRIAEVMEGACRPGHFNGVAQVVSKLFDIVKPDNAYFGEKDFQQVAVIREMVRQLDCKVNIVSCPIVREADGLALSSRNLRLTPEQRQIAPLIARTLKESRNFAPAMTVEEVKKRVCDTLHSIPQLRVEYYEIVDGRTLESIDKWNDTESPTGCIAVFCGEIRLIDNIKYIDKK
ncbi:MAG: pantoate--beta-alanine ligase [Tannerella sp.]|jgi:pantoate--beta-alanine ligase|nr:pantoate--beta-alanine ligase [Tannerella sp.]